MHLLPILSQIQLFVKGKDFAHGGGYGVGLDGCLTVPRGAPRLGQEAAMEKLDRITTNAARMNGEPCIRNLRLSIQRVLEALALYPDRAELKPEYPELEDEDIRQALGFAGMLGGG